MRIRTKLLSLIVMSLLITIFVFLSIYMAMRYMSKGISDMSVYYELTNKVLALNTLSESYLRDPRERARAQWESVYGSLGSLIEQIGPAQPHERLIIDSLREDYRDVHSIFSRLVEGGTIDEYGSLSAKVRERSIGQLSVKLRMMADRVFQLLDARKEEIRTAHGISGLISMMLVTGLMLTSSVVTFLIFGGVSRAILKLRGATNRIASGDLNHRIDHPGQGDELADLARDFNGMVTRLRESYADLEKEINERERIGAELLQAKTDAEARAAEAEEGKKILDALMACIPEGITIADAPDGRIVKVSNYAQQLLGRSEEHLKEDPMGRHGRMWEIYHPDGAAPSEGEELPLARALHTGEVITDEEWVLKRKDGTPITVLCNAGPIRDQAGNVTGGVMAWRSITERKRMEEELRRARDELEIRVEERTAELEDSMRKLEESNQALQDFASIASHDMQEPLRKVQAFGNMLKNQCCASLDTEGKDYLDRMLSATGRMHSLLTSLLEYSRVSTRANPFEEVELKELIGEVLSDLEVRIHQNGGSVKVGELPAIEADPTQMRQLFQNLIGNALKFHKEGEKPVVKVHARNENDHHIIEVEDNGIGFEEKYLDKIFAPFQRLHGRSGSYQGTGMGLAICKKIVERHGGAITARSAPGQGSTFVIMLPVGQDSPEVGRA